jgi:hypothetical protein
MIQGVGGGRKKNGVAKSAPKKIEEHGRRG